MVNNLTMPRCASYQALFLLDYACLVVYPTARSQALTMLEMLRAFWEADVCTANPLRRAF